MPTGWSARPARTASRWSARRARRANRLTAAAKRDYETSVGRAKAEADRLVESGNKSYEGGSGRASRSSSAWCRRPRWSTATAEATCLIDTAHAEADRLRGECDIYVDNKLAEFEEYLNGTLRSVGRGRHQLRTDRRHHDYVSR